jgi:hypothetical protein
MAVSFIHQILYGGTATPLEHSPLILTKRISGVPLFQWAVEKR